MILHMSRGFVLGVLATVFVVGGAAGYVVRGAGSGSSSSETPALARGPENALPPIVVVTPSPPKLVARTTASLKAVPTPGSFYRLAGKETLSDVAKRAYGSTRRLADLVAVNGSLDPKHLSPGTLVYVPLGIEPIPMLFPDLPKAEAPKAPPTPPVKSSTGRASPEPSPLFAKPK